MSKKQHVKNADGSDQPEMSSEIAFANDLPDSREHTFPDENGDAGGVDKKGTWGDAKNSLNNGMEVRRQSWPAGEQIFYAASNKTPEVVDGDDHEIAVSKRTDEGVTRYIISQEDKVAKDWVNVGDK